MGKTEDVLISTLLENTGRSLLDSGGEPDGKGGFRYGYGRNWERNNAAGAEAIKSAPESTVEFREYKGKLEVNVTHSVYHWLAGRLDYDEELDQMFSIFAAGPACPDTCMLNAPDEKRGTTIHDCTCGNERKRQKQEQKGWLELMEGFVERLQQKEHEAGCASQGNEDYEDAMRDIGEECDCILKRGTASEDFSYVGKAPMTVNTYNGEDLLSQTLQWTGFSLPQDGDDYILLQIHGGADVRGGYTRPRVFRVGIDEHSILDNARGSIYCSNPECRLPPPKPWTDPQGKLHTYEGNSTNWSSDDGCNWYEDGGSGGGRVNLEDYPAITFDDGDTGKPVTCSRNEEPHAKHGHEEGTDPLCNFPEELTPEAVSEACEEPTVVVLPKGEALCPLCSKGKLQSGFY